MSNTNTESRLTFIDVDRSLAIILMLQGHFISTTFQDYTAMTLELRMNGTSGNIFFDYWCQLRGFTAPLFFTITGLVFTYLLVKNQKTSIPQTKTRQKRTGPRSFDNHMGISASVTAKADRHVFNWTDK